jgi:8-amino-3,8-dideoxy-alpha-D-manno-octulosonate transaminase
MTIISSIKSDAKNSLKILLARTEVINPFNKLFKEIEFETLSYCNRKCHYCPNVSFERFGEDNDFFMKDEVFETIVGQLKDLSFEGRIAPHLYGEPMSDPRLPKWMRHIKDNLPNSEIKIVTNGDYLNKESYKELIDSGIDLIYLSKHSKRFKKPCIELLESLSEEEKNNYFVINDFYTDFKSDEQEMFNNRSGDIELKENALSKKKPPTMCSYATYPVLNTYGDMILCCNDYQNNYVCGNVMEKSLRDIWYDPENIRLRKRIFKYQLDLKICQDCAMTNI